MCVELWELRSNGTIRVSNESKNTFDFNVIILIKTDNGGFWT